MRPFVFSETNAHNTEIAKQKARNARSRAMPA
jgi:hypothetical protein